MEPAGMHRYLCVVSSCSSMTKLPDYWGFVSGRQAAHWLLCAPQQIVMKLTTLSLSLLLVSASFAQTTVTVTTGSGNSTQTYFSLLNGVQGSAELSSWDLAFEINGFTSSIRVNTAKGLTVYETSTAIADWADLNGPDLENWTELLNSETYWSAGALTHGNDLDQPDGFNVGWGTYNMITHTIMGTKVYVIKAADETYRKLRINSLASGTYSFTYADLDGANEQTTNLQKSAFNGKNHGYFSFDGNMVLDLEPPAAEWDLVFTKYTSVINAPAPTAYAVAGVLQNRNVPAMQIDGVDTSIADWTTAAFDTSINIIGYDWKTYNMGTSMYEYPEDRTYFVLDRNGNIWKLIFTEYGGGSNGDMTFTQELVSSVGLDEVTGSPSILSVFPNPTSDGAVRLVMNGIAKNSMLTLMDASGRIVRQQQLPWSPDPVVHLVDLNGVPSGVYLLRVEGEGSRVSTKLVMD